MKMEDSFCFPLALSLFSANLLNSPAPRVGTGPAPPVSVPSFLSGNDLHLPLSLHTTQNQPIAPTLPPQLHTNPWGASYPGISSVTIPISTLVFPEGLYSDLS